MIEIPISLNKTHGFFSHYDNSRLIDLPLNQLLPYTLLSTPMASVQKNEKMWVVTAMLCRYLEAFTDGIIVMNEKEPLGVLGGKEVLSSLLRNPTHEFFEDYEAEQVMVEHINIISPKTTLGELLLMMMRQRIGIAAVPYKDHGYASISARSLLEIAATGKSDMKVSDLPKKKIVTISPDEPIKDVILTMLKHQTRKLVFDDLSTYISDRGIIEKIALGMNYLANSSDFLNTKACLFNPKLLKKIDGDMKITTLAKIMIGMDVPYVLVNNHIISPWDIILALNQNF